MNKIETINVTLLSQPVLTKSDYKVEQIWIRQGPPAPLSDYIINPICDFVPHILKDEWDSVRVKSALFDQMNGSFFPAVVYKPAIGASNPNQPLSAIFPDLSDELYELLDFLGYRCAIIENAFHLYLPTVDVLNRKWEEYRQLHKDHKLPPLKLISSQGIESDPAFIEAFFTADAIISDDEEDVHDHGVHLVPLFANVLTYKDRYPIVREKMRNLIRQGCEEPLRLAKEAKLDLPYAELKALEGAIVDTLLANDPESIRTNFEQKPFEDAWADKLIEKVASDFLSQSDFELNAWTTYFQKRFPNFDRMKVYQAWMQVQSRGILHRAHLLTETNIMAVEKHPSVTKLAKAMLGLSKMKLLTQQNFELLCQVSPSSLTALESALVKSRNSEPLTFEEFTALLLSGSSLGLIDIVNPLLKLPIAKRSDKLVYPSKVRAFEFALKNRQLSCALCLLEDEKLLKYLDLNNVCIYATRFSMALLLERILAMISYPEVTQMPPILLGAARDPSLNLLLTQFLKSELGKSAPQEFFDELIEVAQSSKNEALLAILKQDLQNSSK